VIAVIDLACVAGTSHHEYEEDDDSSALFSALHDSDGGRARAWLALHQELQTALHQVTAQRATQVGGGGRGRERERERRRRRRRMMMINDIDWNCVVCSRPC